MDFAEDQRLERGTIVQAQGPSEAKGPQVKASQIYELISCDWYKMVNEPVFGHCRLWEL